MTAVFKILALLVVVVGVFYALNSYIYNEKQGEVTRFEDGEHFGFIRAFTDNNTSMDFDDATLLTGVEGQNAAIDAELCTEETREECLPNDYFIENTEEKSERLTIDPNAVFFMQTWNMPEEGEVAEREISLNDFAALINDPTLHRNQLPYTITVTDGIVTRIDEVYIP